MHGGYMIPDSRIPGNPSGAKNKKSTPLFQRHTVILETARRRRNG